MSLTLNTNRLIALGQQIHGQNTANIWASEIGGTLENIASLEKQYAIFDSKVKALQAKPVLSPEEEVELQKLVNCRSGVWNLKDGMRRQRELYRSTFQVVEADIDSQMKADIAKKESDKKKNALAGIVLLIVCSLSIFAAFIYSLETNEVKYGLKFDESLGWNYTTFFSFFYYTAIGIYTGAVAIAYMVFKLKFAYLFIFFILTKMLTYLREEYGWWQGGSLNLWYITLHLMLGFSIVFSSLGVGLLQGEWIWSSFIAAFVAPYGFYFLVVFIVWNVVVSSIRSISETLFGGLVK